MYKNSVYSGIIQEHRNVVVSFNVSVLENPTEYPHKPYIARN